MAKKKPENPAVNSDFLKIMEERGFIHQCTDLAKLDARMGAGRTVGYIGFDCTAPSLHAGSLVQLMILRWMQKTGHKPIILLGGGTTRVGDPSGKDEARKMLGDEDIQKNMDQLRTVFEKFVNIGSGATDAMIVNNNDWLKDLNYIKFLSDFGRYFSVNRMLTQDSVKLRLEREQNLSFLEFNYMILQAYDFVELNQRYDCVLQIGGSDQWGNIIMGIDLQRRLESEKRFQPMSMDEVKSGSVRVLEVQPMIQSKRTDVESYSEESFMNYMNQDGGKEAYGLTTPLLTTAGGAKMGKTAAGAVWLNKDMLSAYEYWQYWRNVDDADVERFLKLFTELPMDEITRLANLKGADINEAKKVLANEATKLLHGDRAAKQAAETARKTFEEGGAGEDLPVYNLKMQELGKGMPAYEMLRKTGIASSGGDARRLIRGGGARINDRKIEDENALIDINHFDDDQMLKLKAGRKKITLVKLIQ
jgi:tyrosyl-tRNA synthetase